MRENMTRSGVVSSLSSVLPTSRMFTSGYVNTETILQLFYKITNERGTKKMFLWSNQVFNPATNKFFVNDYDFKSFQFSDWWVGHDSI